MKLPTGSTDEASWNPDAVRFLVSFRRALMESPSVHPGETSDGQGFFFHMVDDEKRFITLESLCELICRIESRIEKQISETN